MTGVPPDQDLEGPRRSPVIRGAAAQVNIARLREPLDSERLADFVAALDDVNAEADSAPGFLWRLQDDEGNATGITAFSWDQSGSAGVIVNLSTWTGPDALRS